MSRPRLHHRWAVPGLAAALIAALPGCTSLAPTYERPAAPVPAQFPVAVPSADAAVADLDWRQFFADARLRRLWERHPQFVFVPNNPSFFQKIATGLAAIEGILSKLPG